uniref:Uncharacterized protein n=1 Tax=Knipowitschia caucasica TaxID=637954 RepID=A0AAV2JHA4_KNICA
MLCDGTPNCQGRLRRSIDNCGSTVTPPCRGASPVVSWTCVNIDAEAAGVTCDLVLRCCNGVADVRLLPHHQLMKKPVEVGAPGGRGSPADVFLWLRLHEDGSAPSFWGLLSRCRGQSSRDSSVSTQLSKWMAGGCVWAPGPTAPVVCGGVKVRRTRAAPPIQWRAESVPSCGLRPPRIRKSRVPRRGLLNSSCPEGLVRHQLCDLPLDRTHVRLVSVRRAGLEPHPAVASGQRSVSARRLASSTAPGQTLRGVLNCVCVREAESRAAEPNPQLHSAVPPNCTLDPVLVLPGPVGGCLGPCGVQSVPVVFRSQTAPLCSGVGRVFCRGIYGQARSSVVAVTSAGQIGCCEVCPPGAFAFQHSIYLRLELLGCADSTFHSVTTGALPLQHQRGVCVSDSSVSRMDAVYRRSPGGAV